MRQKHANFIVGQLDFVCINFFESSVIFEKIQWPKKIHFVFFVFRDSLISKEVHFEEWLIFFTTHYAHNVDLHSLIVYASQYLCIAVLYSPEFYLYINNPFMYLFNLYFLVKLWISCDLNWVQREFSIWILPRKSNFMQINKPLI